MKAHHINISDLPNAINGVGSVPRLARDGVTHQEAGDTQQALSKFQAALVLTACAQAQLMLDLAMLSMQASDVETGRSYCLTALDQLEMVGQENHALAVVARSVLACLPPEPEEGADKK